MKLVSNLIYFIQDKMEIRPEVWEVFFILKDHILSNESLHMLSKKAFSRFVYCLDQSNRDTNIENEWLVVC